MALLLAPAEVGHKIAEWYSYIIAKELKQAQKMKVEAHEMIDKMEEDDKMIAYYQLVSFRHDLLMARYQDSSTTNTQTLSSIEFQADDYLQFMYYYVSGQHAFLQGKYKSAIRSYKVAEQLLEKVNDPAEKAEFHEKLGISYYRINQYTFATTYIEQALEYFGEHSNYKENEINCEMVLAAIETELTLYESAEIRYIDVLEPSHQYPYTHALVLHNMGLNRVTQNKLEEALSFFEKALSIHEHAESIAGLKTKYYWHHIHLRLGRNLAGFVEMEVELKKHDLHEFEARCMISRGLYIENSLSLVESGIRELEKNELFFECSEVSEEVSLFYESKGDFCNALKFSKLSNAMNKNQTKLGVDQS